MDQIYNQTKYILGLSHYQTLLTKLKKYAKLDRKAFLELYFVSSTTIKSINSEFRNIAKPTDVLSFPVDTKELIVNQPYVFGTIFVCPSYIIKHDQVKIYDEYIIHSFVHLLGFDHQNSAEYDHFIQKTNDITKSIKYV
jgi:probable rRNA maturation factor